jgi:hypothetical protein
VSATDAVARYRTASEAFDLDALMDTMGPTWSSSRRSRAGWCSFELGEDGLIRRIRPHLRPWLAITLFALLLGPKITGQPGVVWRALRRR